MSGFTDEQLLYELMRRNPPLKVTPNYTRTTPIPEIESVIGIGQDDIARIMLCPDEFVALKRSVGV